MPVELSLEFAAELPELEQLIVSLDTFGRSRGWTPTSLLQVKLSLEELVINVMSHGSDGSHLPRILIKLSEDAGHLSVQMADNGLAFDPLQKAAPDLEASLEDRAIGGLGVFLVLEFMDDVSYQRDGDWNRVSMLKALH